MNKKCLLILCTLCLCVFFLGNTNLFHNAIHKCIDVQLDFLQVDSICFKTSLLHVIQILYRSCVCLLPPHNFSFEFVCFAFSEPSEERNFGYTTISLKGAMTWWSSQLFSIYYYKLE